MTTKLTFGLILSFGIATTAFAQQGRVGINTTTPAATFDVVAKNTDATIVDGIIAPRLTGNELKAKDGVYLAAQTGALVYVTAAVTTTPAGKTINVTSAGYYYYDGAVSVEKWIKVASPSLATDITDDEWINNSASTRIELGKTSAKAARGAGTEFVALDNGNVGIGTTSPSVPFQVVKTGDDALNVASFGAADNKRVTISQGGGMKTSGDLNLGKNSTANVNGVLDFNTAQGDATNFNKYTARILRQPGFDSPFNIYQAGTSPMNFYTSAPGSGGLSGNLALSLDKDGNGTILNKFFIKGNTNGLYSGQGTHIAWNDPILTGAPGIGFTNFINNQGTGTGGFIFTGTTGADAANNKEYMRILGNGNVGIGTDAPTTKLEVTSTGTNNPLKLNNLQTGTATDKLLTVDASGNVRQLAPNLAVGAIKAIYNKVGSTKQTVTVGPAVDVTNLTQEIIVPAGKSSIVQITATGYAAPPVGSTPQASQGAFGILVDGVKVTSGYVSSSDSDAAFAVGGNPQSPNSLQRLPSSTTITTIVTLTPGTHTIKVSFKAWFGSQEINVNAFTAGYGGAESSDVDALKSRLTIIEFNN